MKAISIAMFMVAILAATVWAPLVGAGEALTAPIPTAALDFFPDASLHGEMTVAEPAAAEATARVDAVAAAGTFSVTWTYSARSGNSRLPIEGAYVELRRSTITGYLVETTTFTDDMGKVVFMGVGPGTLAAVVFCDDRSVVKVGDGTSDTAYSWTTGWRSHAATTSTELNINDADRGAWSTYTSIRAASVWLEERTGYHRSVVTVNWPDADWPHSHGDEMDLPDSGEYADAIWDSATVIHEYGHCVQYALLGDRFPEGEGPDPHYIYSESSPGFAFSEGWAQFFASAVSGSPSRSLDRTSLESTVYADGSFGYDGDYGDWDGSIVEGAVANVLWDILDGVSDADKPSFGIIGDRVDRQFETLWAIMLEHQVESIDDVWTYWEGKDANLSAIFYNARIKKDISVPSNPYSYTSSHQTGMESDDSTITVTLVGATDIGGEVAGYSVLWNNDPVGMPDASKDVGGSTVTSPVLRSGIDWYLHVRAVDGSGNWANSSYNIGPFRIAEGAVAQNEPFVQAPGWLPTVAVMAVLCVIIIALAAIASSNSARREREKQQESMRLQQMQYRSYQGAGVQSYQMQQNLITTSYMAPICPRCGRVDMGSPHCPYCGWRLR